MVNVALPAIASAFGLAPEQVRWVIVCYVFTYSVTAFAGGAAADRLGYLAVFTTGLAFMAVGFVSAGAASAYGGLLAGRVVQGLGGGMVYGTAPRPATLGRDREKPPRALSALHPPIRVGFR